MRRVGQGASRSKPRNLPALPASGSEPHGLRHTAAKRTRVSQTKWRHRATPPTAVPREDSEMRGTEQPQEGSLPRLSLPRQDKDRILVFGEEIKQNAIPLGACTPHSWRRTNIG